MYIVLYVTPWT